MDVARLAHAKIVVADASVKKPENPIIKRTEPSADGWYETTFTCLTEQIFCKPVI